MLTRRGAFRQRGMDLPKLQTDISVVEGAITTPFHDIDIDIDGDLELFARIDYSCLEFLTPTSRRSSNTNTGSTTTDTSPEAGSSASTDYYDDEDYAPWPRPMDRDIHGRSELKRTAPQWAIRMRLVLSKDFEQDSSARHGWDDYGDGLATQFQRRPSVVDRRYSYGRKIQGGRGRRPSDFSVRSGPAPGLGLAVHYEEDIPFELVLCSAEEDSLYSN